MSGLRIGIVFELIGSLPARPDGPADADVEYEPEETIEVLEGAIRRAGHSPVRLGGPHDLLEADGPPAVDAAWNIAEGHGSRNREAWAPVLLEMLGIPALGSDALTLSLSLDKAWTLDVVGAAGVRVAGHRSVTIDDCESASLPGPWPLFVKPRWEGTAKGIHLGSRVESREALVREVTRIQRDYDQPALVEPFLPGAEYTVTLVGHAPPRALLVLQRALEAGTGIGLHAVESAGTQALAHETPGQLTPELEQRLEADALRAFAALRCRDFARVDFRLDAEGVPHFLEINPLPTFAPDGSFGILAEVMGRSIEALLADVLTDGLRRLGIR